MLLVSAAPGASVLAITLVPLLFGDGAVQRRRRTAGLPDGNTCARAVVLDEGWEGSGGSSAEPLLGLLWPDVDAEAMPGAGSAKRLGVVGSCPAAEPELSSTAGCFVGAEVAGPTSAKSPFKASKYH